MLPIRTFISQEMAFNDILDAEQFAVREAMAHSDVPFQDIVQALKVPRSAQYAPLVQAMITYDDDCECQ